jgi:hypothetical protein
MAVSQDWFDTNQPESPQQMPAQTPGPWASGYVPFYPDPDPNTPGNQNPNMPVLPTAGNPSPKEPAWYTAQQNTSTDPSSQFAQYLARHPNDPQAAIDEWNAAGDPGGLKPAWEPGSKTIGLANGTYLVQPGTGGNTSGSDWQTVQRTGTEGGGSGGNGSFSFPSWDQTFSYAPWDKTFIAPDQLTEQNDPGYKERLQLGEDAIQRTALAQGTGLTGGTLKDLTQYAQTFGSTEYGNVYSRALNDYNTALDAYKLNYNTAAQQYNQKYQQYGDAYNKAYQTYMGNFGVSNTLNQENWANYMGLANLGLAGAAGTNAAGGQFATGATGTITGIGNAGAAGIVGGANATNAGLAGISNIATTTPFLYGTQSSYRPPNQQGYPGQYGGG